MAEEKKRRFGKWTRRAFIGAGSVAGGGLVLGVGGVMFAPNRLKYLPEGAAGEGHLTTWIKISPDNQTTVLIPHCEMGQGALTGLGMLLAEELDADWSLVRIEQAPSEDVYANGYVVRAFLEESGFAVPGWLERALDYGAFKMADFVGLQVTGGSTSTRGTGAFGMRLAGASAKAMLLEAGAEQFGVPIEELTARDSHVVHEASGRRATFGELANLAGTMGVPRRPTLKTREQYRLVGTSRNRADIPSKVQGQAQYGIDVVLPDMLYAAIMRAPVPGGQLTSVDPAPAKAMAGVREVVVLPDAVAVVADGYWQAQQGLNALSPQFTDAGVGGVDTAAIRGMHAAALDTEAMDAAPAGARTIEAEYTVPYLAHVTMEPMCATVRLTDGLCEVWAGTQDPLSSRGVAAEAAGLDRDAVIIHNQQLGGGFGRRLPGTYDYIEQAVQVAKSFSPRPVKLIWSREEDMRHGYYRPFVMSRFRGTLDDQGRLVSWASRFTGSRFGDMVAARPHYAIDDTAVRAVAPPEHLRTGAWRSVAASQHGFFVESFIDELAHAAGRDPVEFRSELLEEEPRHRAVLERAAQMADWGTRPPEGRARGVAVVESFGSIVAQVAEVGLDADGAIRVYRVDAAVDCGFAVNPQQAMAQIQGGVVFGLSAALYHQITVRDGAVEQRNFPDYQMVRLANAPHVNVEFVDNGGPIGGLGEPGVPPVAPAVANALFVLTGQRLRSLPLTLA
ncbi:MAG: xanthine dehydrogenase family protein molybdopterin-binding subunit [Gemmatimonadetes bacterium]|nr:xanthine dehydrogenase family protein molybdopterin-binding subunit [Gemmatimonadota bacterium]